MATPGGGGVGLPVVGLITLCLLNQMLYHYEFDLNCTVMSKLSSFGFSSYIVNTNKYEYEDQRGAGGHLCPVWYARVVLEHQQAALIEALHRRALATCRPHNIMFGGTGNAAMD